MTVKKQIFTDVKIYISAMWYESVAYQNENRNGFGFTKKSFWRYKRLLPYGILKC